MTVRWTFLDPVDSSTAQFDINPNQGGTPSKVRQITSKSTLVPGGRTIIFEGNTAPDEISFSGVIRDEPELTMFTTWFNKLHQVQLNDDLGRTFYVMMTAFTPHRERRGKVYWRHTYEATLTVVDWPA